MKEIVDILINKKKTISTMESCTGGYLVSSITNIEGSSEILKFSAVTYSNEYKIKMGVSSDTINKHTVYSMNVAKEMSKSIVEFTNSNYGIGITGQINRIDPNNKTLENNKVYISIYDKDIDKYYEKILTCIDGTRLENKEFIVDNVIKMLKDILI